MWDVRTANGVDQFIGISHFISRRITKAYRRDATVIYPPVDISGFSFQSKKEDFYLTASRMVPYKKMPMIIKAFASMPDKHLVVIGEGPEFETCLSVAGPNVQLLGWQPFHVLKSHMQRARAFVFAAEEDFGIVPLEAQACGAPVIAYGKGGLLEIIQGLDHAVPTGIFFDQQTPESLVEAVLKFEAESHRFSAQSCRDNAIRFAPDRFRAEFTAFVERHWESFHVQTLNGK